jgi:hypothetical protein
MAEQKMKRMHATGEGLVVSVIKLGLGETRDDSHRQNDRGPRVAHEKMVAGFISDHVD